MITLVISVLSTLISIAAVIIAVRSAKEQKRISKTTIHYNQILEVHKLIMSNPSLLEFHGVSQAVLNQIGITPTEFIYVMLSLEASQVYYEIENKDIINPADFSLYRKTFLSNEKVKSVWQTIYRDSMTDQDHFTKAIDRFYLSNEYKLLKERNS